MSSLIPPRTLQRTYSQYTSNISNTQKILNLNSFDIFSQSFSTNGDICLLDTTSPRIVFNNATQNLPTLTTRSNGTRLIFNANISASTFDTAFGLSSTGIWLTCKNFDIYTNENNSPIAKFGNNSFDIFRQLTTVNLADNFVFSFSNNGDSYFLKNILCHQNESDPTSSGARGIGTKIVLQKQTSSSVYEHALGFSTTNGLWLSSSDKLSVYSIDSRVFSFSKTFNSSLVTNSHTNHTFNSQNCGFTSFGDIGLLNQKSIYFNLLPLNPVLNTNNNGTAIVMSLNCTLGINSTGTYITSSDKTSIYSNGTKVSEIGTITKVLDTKGVNFVEINPSKDDILGAKTFTSNSLPVSSFSDISGLLFDSSTTDYFECIIFFKVTLTNSSVLSCVYNLIGLYDGSVYQLKEIENFDSNRSFSIYFNDNSGQIQYMSDSIPDFDEIEVKYRCVSL